MYRVFRGLSAVVVICCSVRAGSAAPVTTSSVYTALTSVTGDVPVPGTSPNTFTLQNTPVASLACYRNGMFQLPGSDYTISGNVITSTYWQTTDTLVCNYQTSTFIPASPFAVSPSGQLYNMAIPSPATEWAFLQDPAGNTSFNGITVNIFNNGFIRVITDGSGTRFTNNLATTVGSVDVNGNLRMNTGYFVLNPFPLSLQHLTKATDFSTGATTFYTLQSSGSSTTESQMQTAMPGPGTASQMAFSSAQPVGAGVSVTATLRLNGVATALTCTITGSTQTTCNASGTVSWVQNALLDWQVVPSTSLPSFSGSFSAQ